ncbi:CBS domain-containing protein [Candidatus Bathyarchaeota archaeon]|nr:CBS domain-containing protein [Candidatus Bathyarchaeota archaeon]
MSLEITPKLLVREAMSSPVVTTHENSEISQVAKIMRDQKIGAVVINNNEGHPVGIVTERDIVIRVVALNKPDNITVKEVMSSPLRVVKADTTIIDAMKLMDQMNIRRLGVTYKNNLVGIISDKDLIRVMPTIVEIIREITKINSGVNNITGPSTIGYCEHCEAYSNNLRMVDGEFLCEECRLEEKIEEL